MKIALGLAQQPQLLLLDEPMQHLDIGRQFEMIDLIGSLRREGIAILASMHDLALIEGLFPSVWLLSPDEPMRQGAPEEMLRRKVLKHAFNCPPHHRLRLVQAYPKPKGFGHMNSTSSSLAELVAGIVPCGTLYRTEAQRHLDDLTKPLGSLGRLETIAAQIYAIFQGKLPQPLRRGAYVFAADHGVTEEGVSAYPREVTTQMVRNFLAGGAAINVLARLHNAELTVVDVGVDAEFENAPGLHRAKVRRGSRNMLREPAMTNEELAAALEVGIRLSHGARTRGLHLVAVGEMGIGNTTAASAIAAALTGEPVDAVTGRGTGLDTAGRERKIRIVEQSLAQHFGAASRAPEPIEILRCVGGLEIAAMTGFILGAAANRMAGDLRWIYFDCGGSDGVRYRASSERISFCRALL